MNRAYSWKFILFGFVINVFSISFVSASADAGSVGKFQTVSTATHFKTPRNTDVIPAKTGISLISRVNQSKLFFIPLNDEAREYLYETVGPLQMPMVNGEEIPSLASIKSGEGSPGRLGSLPFANCMEMDQSEFEKTVAWASCHAGIENPLKTPRGREYAESYLKPPSDEPSEEEVRQKVRERDEQIGRDVPVISAVFRSDGRPCFLGGCGGDSDRSTAGGTSGSTTPNSWTPPNPARDAAMTAAIDRVLPPPPPPVPPPPPPPDPPPADAPPEDAEDDDDDGKDPETQPDPNTPSDPNPECMDEDEVMSDVEQGSPTYGLTNPVEGTLSGRLGRFAACIMEAELVPQISYCRTDEVAHCDNETGTCTCRPLMEEGEGEPQSFQCQTMNIDCVSNPTHDCCQ